VTPAEYLAIPYLLEMESVQDDKGEWRRRAAYPELGVSAEADSPLEALDLLEEARVAEIQARLERGERVPVPRPPLASRQTGVDPRRLEFARWLVDQGRVGDS
jgi:hypothetical protein